MQFERRCLRGLVAGLALLGSVSCRGPSVWLEVNEPGAALAMDGVYAGTGCAEVPQTYYGTAHVTIAPTRTGVIEDVRTTERRTVDLPPPAPRWLFPLDLLLEAWARGFGDAEDVIWSVEIAPPAASLVAGVPPPQPEPLRARAAAIQLAR